MVINFFQSQLFNKQSNTQEITSKSIQNADFPNSKSQNPSYISLLKKLSRLLKIHLLTQIHNFSGGNMKCYFVEKSFWARLKFNRIHSMKLKLKRIKRPIYSSIFNKKYFKQTSYQIKFLHFI